MPRRAHPPIHPGEILETEFLEPLELSQYRLAKEISVSARRINEIVHGDRAISADTALRLARYFGTTDEFWPAVDPPSAQADRRITLVVRMVVTGGAENGP